MASTTRHQISLLSRHRLFSAYFDRRRGSAPPFFSTATSIIMSKIKEMVAEHIISGFKGKLDFYYYMGQACVRRWPRSPGSNRSPGVMSTWSAFSYASREWANLSPAVQRTYEELATGSGLTARDMFMRSYLTGLYRNPTP